MRLVDSFVSETRNATKPKLLEFSNLLSFYASNGRS